jgi:hypothetical protein
MATTPWAWIDMNIFESMVFQQRAGGMTYLTSDFPSAQHAGILIRVPHLEMRLKLTTLFTDREDLMRIFWFIPVVLFVGCGPQYTIPNFDSGEIEKVISSGHSPQSCIEHLKEDADQLKVTVRLTDVHHEAASGPIAWLYTYAYVCTGKVIKSNSENRKAL